MTWPCGPAEYLSPEVPGPREGAPDIKEIIPSSFTDSEGREFQVERLCRVGSTCKGKRASSPTPIVFGRLCHEVICRSEGVSRERAGSVFKWKENELNWFQTRWLWKQFLSFSLWMRCFPVAAFDIWEAASHHCDYRKMWPVLPGCFCVQVGVVSALTFLKQVRERLRTWQRMRDNWVTFSDAPL